NFIIPQHPGQIMQRLRRLFNRARPDEKELNILRGVLSAIEKNSGDKS
ncbi:MAG: tRNA (cytosine(32)/uridine(32)-2'-O)-methyltransferase TrmJ, partial [Gammaproteobacteria bacterium]